MIFAKLWFLKGILILLILIFSIYVFSSVNQERQVVKFSIHHFSYPSTLNFYRVLQMKNIESITKLFPYEPKLINEYYPRNQSDTNIVIIVKSSLENNVKRNAIRESWGSENCQLSYRYQVYFALGQKTIGDISDSFHQSLIDQESKTNKDILQFNFIDKYVNNTYKVAAIFDYFVKSHGNTSYLVIVDDDYMIDPSVLLETINNEITAEEYPRFLAGYVWYKTKPIRNCFSKWYISYDDYKHDYYPPYPAGGFIIISNPMVKKFNTLLPYLKYMPIDDVVIGIIMFKLKIYPTHFRNIFVHKPDPIPKNLLASHGFSKDLNLFWKKYQYDKKCVAP